MNEIMETIISEVETPPEKVGMIDTLRIKKLVKDYNEAILTHLERKYNENQKGRMRISTLRLEIGFPTIEKNTRMDPVSRLMVDNSRQVAILYLRTDDKVFYQSKFYTEYEDKVNGSLIGTLQRMTATIMRHGLSHYVKIAKPLTEELI